MTCVICSFFHNFLLLGVLVMMFGNYNSYVAKGIALCSQLWNGLYILWHDSVPMPTASTFWLIDVGDFAERKADN